MSAGAGIPARVSDYYVLPLRLPPHPALHFEATHYIYFKPHTTSVPTAESSRSLFLVNIPIDSTVTHLKHLFSKQIGLPAGRIADVVFNETPTKKKTLPASAALGKTSKKRKRGSEEEAVLEIESTLPSVWDRETYTSGSTAVVIFVDRASLDAAVKATRAFSSKGNKVTWGDGITNKTTKLGSYRKRCICVPSSTKTRSGYLAHASLTFPSRDSLLSAVNNYMTIFNSNQEVAAKSLARKRSMPDEDGFVTVTRGGRNAAARMEDAQESLERQKERQKGLNDFYRFQGREARKEKALELVKRFEGDKEKVRQMKARGKNFKA